MAIKKINTQLQVFNFADGISVRTFLDANGMPWFVAADVCSALELSNTSKAVSRLDDDEKGVTTGDTLGGKQELTTINESGLYSLIMTSRKEEAKKFKKWVTSEVLPTIRKTGSYGAGKPPALPPAKPVTPLLTDDSEQWYLAKMQSGAIIRMVRADEPCAVKFMNDRFPHLEVVSREAMRQNLMSLATQLTTLSGQFITTQEINNGLTNAMQGAA
ncbi:MAG: hypothetical protein BWK73_04550 [Thiothrix lacustris]|uniref:Bro-N domain-containing protein n=1 Tax=Thiothrix lacustris TaxID=525917 RepID=A0A1Y1QXK7_9GAMM|nr:MAG: hypothetical protein BWK73_04550 [Thiothrix lacustris]